VSWALLVAVLALLFTVASFWWLNAGRGSLQVGQSGAYAFAIKPMLRLPTAFHNTGPRALIVTDLRLLLVEDAAQPPLRWIATTSQLRPEQTNERDFATPLCGPRPRHLATTPPQPSPPTPITAIRPTAVTLARLLRVLG
jgi:hypothetical protein